MRRTKDDLQRQEAAALFRSLGNPNRLAILGALLEGQRAVGELESLTGIRQPILSQQLAILREAGLLETNRDGKSIVYRLADRQAGAIARVLRAALDPGARDLGGEERRPAVAPPREPRSEAYLAAAVFARVEPAPTGVPSPGGVVPPRNGPHA